jgi:hypothetical protein
MAAHWPVRITATFFRHGPPMRGQLAKRMGRSQQWIKDIDQGQHRVSVIEFEFAEALGFDPHSAIGRIARVKG